MADDRFSARLTVPDALKAAEVAAWERLCQIDPAFASPFLSVHYARAVAATGRDVRICVLYTEGRPCAFLAFQVPDLAARLLSAAELVGGQMTDYFGLVAERGVCIAPARLMQLARLQHLTFSHLDQSQLEFGLSGEQARVGLRIRLDSTAASPLQALLADSPKYRKDSERRARQLAAEIGPIEFVLDVRAGRAALIEELVRHKRAQYQRTNAADALDAPWKLALLEQLAQTESDGCRGLLSSLSAGGQWVAIHFGIVANGVLQYWLPVYNPAMSKYAPGRLLIHHIIEASALAGIHTIDRGEGDTSSKRELANEEHLFYRGAWIRPSLSSSVMRGINSLKWRFGA
jgi:CelD/BcsL family acetyltransferase involved in cellulose biosynthesis